MAHYIGLDVSMKETSICIVTEKGKLEFVTHMVSPDSFAKYNGANLL